jgi:anti-sigma regulatory factor (Ser/Thr protein kinase)
MQSAAALSWSGGAQVDAGSGFRMQVNGGPEAASRARAELAHLCGDLDPPLLDSVRLLVTELVTNSVRHANAAAIELAVMVGADRVRVEVANPGGTFEPRPREDTESGWGLFLIDRLSDAWGVEESGSGLQRVWFEIGRT